MRSELATVRATFKLISWLLIIEKKKVKSASRLERFFISLFYRGAYAYTANDDNDSNNDVYSANRHLQSWSLS